MKPPKQDALITFTTSREWKHLLLHVKDETDLLEQLAYKLSKEYQTTISTQDVQDDINKGNLVITYRENDESEYFRG